MRKIISDNNIPKSKPVTIDGWSETNGCFKIKEISNLSQEFKGLTLKSITASTVYVDSVITSGTVNHMDTSSFSQGDILYVNSSGNLVNTDTGSQEIGIVRKSHATLGRLLLLPRNNVSGIPWEDEYLVPSTTDTYTLDYPALERGIVVMLDSFLVRPSQYTKNKTGKYVTSLTFDTDLYSGNVLTVFYTRA